jgi:1-acyl-sn-glycerol-3-phosphate acyltransferase
MLRWRPTRRGELALRAVKLLAVPAFKLYFRLGAEGVDRIPPGPAILAPNHVSFLDPFVLQAVLRRRVFFMVTSDYFDLRRFHWFLKLMDSIRVDEDHLNRAAMRDARNVLASGRLLGIFPEGSISRDGLVHDGQAGAAALMLAARAPVVPVGIDGTFRALHRHARFPRPVRITVRFGEPLDLASLLRRDGGRRSRRERITELLMESIARLARAPRASRPGETSPGGAPAPEAWG